MHDVPLEQQRAVAHAAALEAGDPGYLDPQNGLFVMTADYLQDRGWCCGSGCRHCPYDKEQQ